ncbi:amino acid ABC transporter permease [Nocardia sp. XZ_19_385]|uniref:amino acid ABC transporter permease n=1 Tax=Nocardia sp. XZ_19_385 TaxID=2769488 RepID=UPI001890504A|nr:amino acid ABC transporter permease [Nocardia sp. XZ_19_385]
MTKRASVLFDAPGPKARVRYLIYSVVVVAAVLAGGVWLFLQFQDKGQFTADKWRPFTESAIWETYLLPGIQGTLTAAVLSIVLALIVGMIFGILRMSEHRAMRGFAGTLVEVARSIPVLILMIFLYAIFSEYKVFDTSQRTLAAVVTALTIYNGSVIAEIVRAGIRSLPKGQTEAAVALGMRKNQLMRLVLLPQAVTAMLPALVSQMVVALKDTALGYLILYTELVRSSFQMGAALQNTIPALLVAGVIMIAFNSALTVLATKLEQRLRSRKKGGAVVAADSILTDAAPGVDLTQK